MAIKKRQSTYWLDVTVNGVRTRQSLHTADKAKATELHDKLKATMWDKEYLHIENHLWDEAISRWCIEKRGKRTLAKDMTIASYFAPFFAGKQLKDLDFEKALSAKAGVSPTTLNRYKAFLRSLFRQAKYSWGWKVATPHFTFAKEIRREVFITDEVFADLLNVLPERVRDLVEFASITGLRRGNLSMITKNHYQNNTLTFTADEMKAGKPFAMPVTDRAVELLVKHNFRLTVSENDYLLFKKASATLDIEGLRFHDLRHRFATKLGQRGVPLDIVSKLLGHSSIASTERYRHYNVDEMRKYV